MKTKYQNKRYKCNRYNRYREIPRIKIAIKTIEPYPDQTQMANVGNASAPNIGLRIALGPPT